jgi:hypothetical protein
LAAGRVDRLQHLVAVVPLVGDPQAGRLKCVA